MFFILKKQKQRTLFEVRQSVESFKFTIILNLKFKLLTAETLVSHLGLLDLTLLLNHTAFDSTVVSVAFSVLQKKDFCFFSFLHLSSTPLGSSPSHSVQ